MKFRNLLISLRSGIRGGERRWMAAALSLALSLTALESNITRRRQIYNLTWVLRRFKKRKKEKKKDELSNVSAAEAISINQISVKKAVRKEKWAGISSEKHN